MKSGSFYASVQLTDWFIEPRTAASFRHVAGKCTIKSDEDIAGFKMRTGNNANFVVTVEGPSGEKVHILGCKVYVIAEFVGDSLPEIGAQNTYIVP